MKVLVPLDFSEEAEKALKFAQKQGWDIVVLHVLEEGLLENIFPFYSSPSVDFKKFVDERRKWAEKELEKYPASKRIVKVGRCWKEIVRTAEEEGVDMIVMTGRGIGKVDEIEEILLGSCAERVLRHSKIPVLVVK